MTATGATLPVDLEDTSMFERAGKAGCLSVERQFVQLHSKRGVESRVTRFVCASDAQFVVARSSELLAPNPYSPVSVVGEMVPVSIELAGVEAFRAWELSTFGPYGAGSVLYIAGSVGDHVFALACASIRHRFARPDVVALCELQASRIRGVQA